MMIFTSRFAILLFLILLAKMFYQSVSSDGCNEKDRGILLKFKQGVIDPYNRLSSWSNTQDCCAWKGVQCDNITGRVTNLDLRPYGQGYLQGELNLSLLELEFLSSLDVSFNDFYLITIPSIHNNTTLSSNLNNLQLSLSGDHLHIESLHWLSQLSSLKNLDLSLIDLHKETNWLQFVATLPLLSELRMSGCNLTSFGPSLKHANYTSLEVLDLSSNNFYTELPHWFFNISSHISDLYLSKSKIHGGIPLSLLNLRNLEHLSLSNNQLNGPIPDWIGQLEQLQHLDLSNNMFGGSIPLTIGNLSSLQALYIGSNPFSNAISEICFTKLSSLKYLDLSNITAPFHFDPEWVPPFQLNSLSLDNSNQGPNLLAWIYTQKSLQILSISGSGISFTNEDKFWMFQAGVEETLDMSNNLINGDISNVTLNSSKVYLDGNNFTGGLPHISPNVLIVDLSQNSFSGPIPQSWATLKGLSYINLWSNKLSGEVPMDLSNLTQLNFVNLGRNEFSGTIPTIMSQSLQVLVLRSNQFEGNIPLEIFNLSSLYHLDLAHNKLSGSMPHCIYNMTQMIRYNIEAGGAIAARVDLFTKGQVYVYDVHPNRRTIDLSVNNLSGGIPLELFRLVQIQTLNLSYNHLSGTIHEEIGDLKNMESLDLSNNKLSGQIPPSLAGLTFMGYLNLSYNNFVGLIPIGTQLQSFDASSYIGNPKLCGAPLKKCFTEEKNPDKGSQDAEDGGPERESFYLGMGVGFAFGFWGVFGSLLLYRKWRHTYYRFLDWVADKLSW
ncbi:hypothetical protein RJT34_00359 [Clitoria ternatea]|uniref:Leucine-rich repeat-containing N-terminal plant-type domain-containing protein n=1 Tax=Clitoria ternatea TaxID=43366 RepID=A0AAN9KI57_CLITE